MLLRLAYAWCHKETFFLNLLSLFVVCFTANKVVQFVKFDLVVWLQKTLTVIDICGFSACSASNVWLQLVTGVLFELMSISLIVLLLGLLLDIVVGDPVAEQPVCLLLQNSSNGVDGKVYRRVGEAAKESECAKRKIQRRLLAPEMPGPLVVSERYLMNLRVKCCCLAYAWCHKEAPFLITIIICCLFYCK